MTRGFRDYGVQWPGPMGGEGWDEWSEFGEGEVSAGSTLTVPGSVVPSGESWIALAVLATCERAGIVQKLEFLDGVTVKAGVFFDTQGLIILPAGFYLAAGESRNMKVYNYDDIALDFTVTLSGVKVETD